MWNNLRARHYSVLILLAIVALETSAIAIDRFINRESETAFAIESPFQNNPFIQSFRMADASCAVLPVKLGSRKNSTTAAVKSRNSAPIQTVSAEFIAAASEKENFSKFVEYAVQPGDSLSNIAMLFGSETDAIKRYNRLDDRHSIMAGQTIRVPMPSQDLFYTVKKGDSLTRIASRFRIQLKDIVEANNLKTHMLVADQRIKIPVTENKPTMAIVEPAIETMKAPGKLELVREAAISIVPEQKLEMVKLEKVQMAIAPAARPKIEFVGKELLAQPPQVTEKVAAAVSPVASQKVDSKDNHEVTYTVDKGDSLMKIAQRFNTTVAQLQEVNGLKGTFLKVGQEIRINPDKKLYRVVKAEEKKPEEKKAEEKKPEISSVGNTFAHVVKNGESISLIARKYRTTVGAIVEANCLKNTVVMAGQTIKVPAERAGMKNTGEDVKDYKVVQGRSEITRASWRMPVRGRLSDKYGWRKHPVYRKRLFHAGIDIAAPKGTPIAAAAAGKVIYAGRRPGYGNLVIVSHAGGMSSRYAHCSSILVKKGQSVKAGALLARVGATGVATGNHLHFEVRKNGKPQNPLSFLR